MPLHPRPILKRNWSRTGLQIHQPLPFTLCKDVQSPHVHFPPTPAIASEHTADSPGTYDRRPIVLSPATDVLCVTSPPAEFEVERTERGRSPYPKLVEEGVKGSYFHPRAFEACEPEDLDELADSAITELPPLLRDTSPDGDDSDEVITPPDPKLASPVTAPATHLDSPLTHLFAAERGKRLPLYGVPTKVEERRRPLVRIGKEPFVPKYEVHLQEEGASCLSGF